MINKIIGAIWILIGLIGLIKPLYIHNMFKKKAGKRKFKLFIALVFIFGSIIVELFFKYNNVFWRIATAIVFLAALKGFWWVNKKAGEKITGYLSQVPLVYFRIIALIFIAVGFIFFKIL
jgi:hypothetical protein